ncbi:MAG: hypothetical protein Kow00122_14570 [Thermoleophilia bacterium]
MSSSKLYVGNLSYETASETLERVFSEHGQVVSANVITDRDTGRSKGFGFVEMSSPEEAKTAMDAKNGSEVDGRTIKVDLAKEQAPRRSGGLGGGYGGGRRGSGNSYGSGRGGSRW